jgi:hypothetical protein
MIQLIVFLFVGLLLFSSLIFMMRRNPRPEGGSGALVEARQALNALQVGLLPPELIGRIFAKEDLEYVLSEAPLNIQELFLEERKKTALCWVNQVRTQILSLKRFHLGSARFYARLSMKTEMELALDFAALLTACRALQIAMYVWGPYAAPKMVDSTAAAAARVCKISEASLDFLNPAHLSTAGGSSAGAARL